MTNQYFSYIFWLYLTASTSIYYVRWQLSQFFLHFSCYCQQLIFIAYVYRLEFLLLFSQCTKDCTPLTAYTPLTAFNFQQNVINTKCSVILIQEEVQTLSTLPVMRELSVFFGVVIAHSTERTFSKWLISNSYVTDEGTLFHTTSILISLVLFKASFLSLNFFHLFLRLCSNLLWSSEYFFSVNRHVFVSAFPEIFH